MCQPTASRPSLNLAELPEAITMALRGHQQPCSVRELHRELLEHYEVDFGLVLAVVLHQTRRGELRPKAYPPAHMLYTQKP